MRFFNKIKKKIFYKRKWMKNYILNIGIFRLICNINLVFSFTTKFNFILYQIYNNNCLKYLKYAFQLYKTKVENFQNKID